jgi:hypothetical protein
MGGYRIWREFQILKQILKESDLAGAIKVDANYDDSQGFP